MLLRRREILNQPILPAGYQQVEYIKTTGNGGIKFDTGLSMGNIGKMLLKINFISINNNNCDTHILGGRQNSGAGYVSFLTKDNSNSFIIRYSNSETSGAIDIKLNPTLQKNIDYVIESKIIKGQQYCKVNGTTVASGSYTSTGTYSFRAYIGTWNGAGSTSEQDTFDAIFYYMKLYDTNMELIRDYYPCYRKSDNVIGLYDLITKTFSINGYSKQFIAGKKINKALN